MPLWDVWPPFAGFFLLTAFLMTLYRITVEALEHASGKKVPGFLEPSPWFELVATFAGGLGAVTAVIFLLYRKRKEDADDYGVLRGLATGYYFNLIKPLIGILRAVNDSLEAKERKPDANETLYQEARDAGADRIAGLIICLPEEPAHFNLNTHESILRDALASEDPPIYTIKEIRVRIAGRPRPVIVQLAVNIAKRAAVLVDIPSTLSVIPDFTRFLSEKEAEKSGRSDLVTARTTHLAIKEAGKFPLEITSRYQPEIDAFQHGAGLISVLESGKSAPAFALHFIPVRRLRYRADELTGS
jgi:hypothetical protein